MRVYEALDCMALQRADAVVAVSAPLMALLRRVGVSAQRLLLLRNVPASVERPDRDAARRALGLPSDATIVGWVGRFSHEKGADRLPVLLQNPASACTLALVGDGPLREAVLESLAPLSHLDVRWLGVRRDIGPLFAAFDLLVLPSRTEGMPMVVLEAMAAATPVAGFAVGDVAYAVTEQTGWCVPAEHMQALASAVHAGLHDPELRRQRGKAGQAHVHKYFSGEAWVAAHRNAYGL
jgi:glycosyltransferase involved in cell wall biosynthesis